VTKLLQGLRDELVRRDYAATTIRSYVQIVDAFRQHTGARLDRITPTQLRCYHLFLLEDRRLAIGTVVTQICALRFFCRYVLKRRDVREDLPYPKSRHRLPVVLSPDEVQRLRDVVARLHAIPGVDSVAASGMTPMSGRAGSAFLRVEGFDEPAHDRQRVSLNTVSPNYFLTYGTPLLAGRDFRDSDMDQPRRIIVNQALARKYFPGRDPLGRHVWLENQRDPYEIVGVAGNAKYNDVRLPSPPIVYQFALMSSGSSDLSLRTSGRRAGLADDARRLVNDVFGTNSVGRVTTLAEQVDASIVPERLLATLAGFFGAVGALLAAIGLFGLLAYTVARQTKEIGIRMALGATRGRVSRMVATSAGWLVSVGFLLGAPTAFWSTRFAARSVENLPAGGAVPIASAAAALIAVAFIAVYVPTRRATRVEPVIALRAE
jgi:putative ABC transport system permease protein